MEKNRSHRNWCEDDGIATIPMSITHSTISPGSRADADADDTTVPPVKIPNPVSSEVVSVSTKPAEVRKQVSIFLPVSDWKILRHEAARRQIPITELCRMWIGPGIAELKRDGPSKIEDDER